MHEFFQQLSIDIGTTDFWKELTPNGLLLGTLHMLVVLNFQLIWALLKKTELPKFLREPPLSILLPSNLKDLLILALFYLCIAFVLPSLAIVFLRF